MLATLQNKLRSKRFHLAACLLALAFLLAEGIALAHELRHDFQQHDDTSCVLHLYAEHLAKAAIASNSISLLVTDHELAAPTVVAVISPRRTRHYRSRAPPHFSRSQIA